MNSVLYAHLMYSNWMHAMWSKINVHDDEWMQSMYVWMGWHTRTFDEYEFEIETAKGYGKFLIKVEVLKSQTNKHMA